MRFPGDIHARLLGTRTVRGCGRRLTRRGNLRGMRRSVATYAGGMRAQAGAAALVVAILTGCQASEQAKQRTPESVASSPDAQFWFTRANADTRRARALGDQFDAIGAGGERHPPDG